MGLFSRGVDAVDGELMKGGFVGFFEGLGGGGLGLDIIVFIGLGDGVLL